MFKLNKLFKLPSKKSVTYGSYIGDTFSSLLTSSSYKYDINFYIGAYETNPVVHAAVDKIANIVSGLPVIVNDTETGEKLEEIDDDNR